MVYSYIRTNSYFVKERLGATKKPEKLNLGFF